MGRAGATDGRDSHQVGTDEMTTRPNHAQSFAAMRKATERRLHLTRRELRGCTQNKISTARLRGLSLRLVAVVADLGGCRFMQRSFFITVAIGTAMLTSCSTPRGASNAMPTLEVEQVTHQWEVVIRLYDSAASRNPRCGIFTVLEGDDGKKVEAHVADVRLKETDMHGFFIGIYSNGKEFSHGTKVVAIYRRITTDSPIRAATKMFYH